MESIHNHATVATIIPEGGVHQKAAMGDVFSLFTPADVLIDFNVEFLDEGFCQSWILMSLHPGAPLKGNYCPGCGSEIPERLRKSFWSCIRIKCDYCGKYFTALTGTFLSGCHFDFREIVLLAFMLGLGVEDKQIAATLKISAESVRLWRLKFKDLEKVKA